MSKVDRFVAPRDMDAELRLDVAKMRGQAHLPPYASPDDRVRSWAAANRGLAFVPSYSRPRSSPAPTGPATGAALSLSEQARINGARERMSR